MAQRKRKAMKKNPDYNLEKRRPTFLFVGLMASLAMTLVAFDWTTYDKAEYAVLSSEDLGMDIDVIKPHILKKPEPVAAKKAQLRKSPLVKVVKEPTEPSQKVHFTLNPDTDFRLNLGGEGDEFDEPYEEPLEIGWYELQNKPHFADCENVVDRKAQASCTEAQIIEFVMKNAKFPEHLVGVNQTVYVNFIIDEKGNVTDVEPALEGIRAFDKAAVKAVEKLPRMVPGTQLGNPVRVKFMIPVRFTSM